MAGNRSILSLGRTLADEDQRTHELLATSTSSGPWDPQCPSRPQAGDELALERTATLDVEGLVDGLGRDPHGAIMGEVDGEPVRDLLGAPGLGPSSIRPPAVRYAAGGSLPHILGRAFGDTWRPPERAQSRRSVRVGKRRHGRSDVLGRRSFIEFVAR